MELTGSRIRPSQDRACCLQIYSRDQKNSPSSIFNDDNDFKAVNGDQSQSLRLRMHLGRSGVFKIISEVIIGHYFGIY